MTTAGDQVFLTGATGFIGGHVLQALLGAGYAVRALARRGSSRSASGQNCDFVEGDLGRPGDLTRSLAGCRYLVHVAALYSFAPGKRSEIHQINVLGTAGLLEAARIAGIEKAVVTSSSATVGPARPGELATERDWAPETGPRAAYHHSKLEQERVALAAQLPVVLVLPTMPVGPNDWKPTPSGKMIVDFMRGRIRASLGGGLNLVPVEDVALGHVLALRKGCAGERYLLGGENLTLTELWALLATICHRPAPSREIPYSLALGLGWLDELRCRLSNGQEPLVPLEGVRMARERMWVSSVKAREELGFEVSAVTPALERAVQWYRDHGYAF